MTQIGTEQSHSGAFGKAAAPDMPERRADRRHRVLKGARLSFNKGFGAAECVVRNVSEHGARLAFGDTAAVPPHFDLLISGEDRPRAASVRWRTMSDIGVELA